MTAHLHSLLDLLEAHPPVDATEADHRQRMIELVEAGLAGRLDPFSRTTFAPGHFTASSFVLHPDQRAVLLILHAKLGFWMQPGGHFEAEDASLIAAARREVAEETGLAELRRWASSAPLGLLDVDIHTIPARRSEPEHLHFDLRFLFRSPSAQLVDSDEVHGAQWVPVEDFEHVRSDASVMRAVQRIRQLLGPPASVP